MKELKLVIEGRGSMKGCTLTQKKLGINSYIYEVSCGLEPVRYEVFKKIKNARFNCWSYPGDESFGTKAWCVTTGYERALQIFNKIEAGLPVF